MAEDILKVERHPNYATITLNRPEKRNSLNEALLSAMDKAFAAIEEDKEIRAVILRGAGKSFSAGLDLAEADRLEGGHTPVSIERTFHRLEQLPVPTIAAVQGAALAGGCELALHCDLRVAAEDARIGMTVARVGLVVPYSARPTPRKSSTPASRSTRSARFRWGWCTRSCPTTSSTRRRSRGPRKCHRMRRFRCAR